MKKMLFALLLCISSLIIAEQQYKLTINNTTDMGLDIFWVRYHGDYKEAGKASTIPPKKSKTVTLPTNIFEITGTDAFGVFMKIDDTTFKSEDTFNISITKVTSGHDYLKATK